MKLRALSLLIIAYCGLQAQPPKLEFEVASVRRVAEPPQVAFCIDPCPPPSATVSGQVTYKGQLMIRLLTGAFQTGGSQIDGPDWLGTERYDIAAKVPADTPRAQTWEMLKNLLIDRFHMQYHITQKDFEVYTLEIAKNGPKLKRAGSPIDPLPTRPPGRLPLDADGFPILPDGYPGIEDVGHDGVLHLVGRMTSLDDLLGHFRGLLMNQHLFNKTGLTENYDIRLRFDYTQLPRQVGRIDFSGPSEPAPDIFKALEQQLGLKLEKSRAPLDVVVIDHLDKIPTEN